MDTFKIKIKQNLFLIQDQTYFQEVKSSEFGGSNYFKRDRTNNTFRKELMDKGLYVPKYKLAEGDFGSPEKSLVFEFSGPKLIHGNNYQEVTEKDFPQVVEKVLDFCKLIKVNVFRTAIEKASTMIAAYSRNLPVAHLAPAKDIIKILAPFNYRPRSEYTATFRQGEMTSELKYFNVTGSHLVLYDKLAEIIAKGHTKEEKEIIRFLTTGEGKEKFQDWIKETVRVELTLHTKVAVKQALAKYYGKKNDYTFAEAFKDKIRDDLLTAVIGNVFNHPLKEIVLLSSYDRDVFNKVIEQYAKSFSSKAEIRLALDILFSRGLKDLRAQIIKQHCERTWFRKQKLLKQISDSIALPQGILQLDNAQVLKYLLAQFGIKPDLKPPNQLTLFR
jgi:hypothetical protein